MRKNAKKISIIALIILVATMITILCCSLTTYNQSNKTSEFLSNGSQVNEEVSEPYFFNSHSKTLKFNGTKFKFKMDPKDNIASAKNDICNITVDNKSNNSIQATVQAEVTFRYDGGSVTKSETKTGINVFIQLASGRGDIKYVEVTLTITANGSTQSASKSFGKW